jgi:SAM-dependent methyltransferase
MSEHTGKSYDAISKQYVEKQEDDDKAPFNAYYERPGMLSLLPDLTGLRVLDAGCGTGKLAEIMVKRGAQVMVFDYNAEFVQKARDRLGNRAAVHQGDFSKPLTFARDDAFDVVTASLVMHYLKDWSPALGEVRRVLKPGGLLVFSTHHPVLTWQVFKLESYHEETLIQDEWEGIGKVQYYHRSLNDISRALSESGFVIECLLEPQPTEDFRRVDPKGYQKVTTRPWFLLVRARRI